MDMLRGQRTTQEGRAEIAEGQVKDDVAITPLGMPMLAGLGAISTVMVLAGQAHTIPEHAAIYGAIALTMIISWLTLRTAVGLVSRVGETGIRVMTRILGLLLGAVAVQFVLTGVREGLGLR